MKSQKISSLPVDRNNLPYIEEYLNERPENIKYIKKLVQKNKFSERTFYLSCMYVDILIVNIYLKKFPGVKKSEVKSDLISIGCLLLASILFKYLFFR
jgi:hypothetical protein